MKKQYSMANGKWQMGKGKWKTFIFIFAICHLPSPMPFAVAAKPPAEPPFAIPPRNGDITDYYPGVENSPRQLVVMIQDLHANVGVQKNIASILYRLLRLNKGPSLLVCVEGASGEGDVSLLRSLPRFIRQGFEALLLHKAYLTGAELAATEAAAQWEQQENVLWDRIKSWFRPSRQVGPVSLSPILLWGVDDPDLYRKNWRAAKYVDREHSFALEEVKGTRAVVSEGASGPLKKQLDLVVKLLLLRLQPKEYQEYRKYRALNPRGSRAYEQVLAAAETYYEAAEARSKAMVNNLVAKMGSTPGYTALVSGGFHTQEMAEQLKARKMPYVVITPRVTVLDQDEAYRARLREEE
jgi:hypothetical protein